MATKKKEFHFGGLAFCPSGVGGPLPNKPENYVTKAKTFLLQHPCQAESVFFCDFVYFGL